MKFIADLHIHSKYSRATAKNLDLENLYIAARKKGITVVGTGDFTHPQWFSELKEKLEPAEPGLFRLKEQIAEICDRDVPDSCTSIVRFVLESEISNIYKKDGKTRKNHNLVFFPDLEKAEQFNSKLDRIGNIKSDGRPILGLDARNLLEILLETSEQAFLVPAHIWTPWFSLLGSKSGFNSIAECFDDLSSYIFAAETGLSSDPPMNWRVSDLDRITLISNSDAHSPAKLGREANLFDTELDYFSIRQAIEGNDGDRFLGTFEFYPEEGKYHMDGHRKCNIRLMPKESKQYNGICPVCGRPLTLGVLYRVEELADRSEGHTPENSPTFYSIVPLQEIISELLQVGPQSKKVRHHYETAIQTLGSEFDILHELDPSRMDSVGVPRLGEAIQRMRDGTIKLIPGYDGEFGKIRIFADTGKKNRPKQKNLFAGADIPDLETEEKTVRKPAITPDSSSDDETSYRPSNETIDLNARQREAVLHMGSPLLIVAGPGTGKTFTLTRKIACFIKERNVDPEHILAVTFTNKAAQEMTDRLTQLLPDCPYLPFVSTFHALCYHILKNEHPDRQNSIIDEDEQRFLIKEVCNQMQQEGMKIPVSETAVLDMIIAAKQNIIGPDEDMAVIAEPFECSVDLLQKIYAEYQNILLDQGVYDFEDLIFKVVKLLETNTAVCRRYTDRFTHIFIDEYQDLNQGQYRIVRALASESPNLFAIGDPDQSIYGFRGSDVQYFHKFMDDYPSAKKINLTRNYRSTETILQASFHVIRNQKENSAESRVYSDINGKKTVSIVSLPTEKAEAVAIGKTIERMIGGLGFHSIDYQKVDSADSGTERSFSDFAVLYRTNTQGAVLAETFLEAGIPFQQVSRDQGFSKKGIREIISGLKISYGIGTYADFSFLVQATGKGIGQKSIHTFINWCIRNHFRIEQGLHHALRFPVQGMGTAAQLKLTEFINNLFICNKDLQNRDLNSRIFYLHDRYRKNSREVYQGNAFKETFSRLQQTAVLYKDRVDDFFTMLSLSSDVDSYDGKSEKVALMTMHAAKGLEFPVVFIAGCEEGLIPYQRGEDLITDMDEEKRLFYVAMTRAKENLFLTHAAKRQIFGKRCDRKISSFVYEIEEKLRRHEKAQMKNRKPEKKPGQIQLELF